MTQPWEKIAALITEPSENGARLRQSSPFAGILTRNDGESMKRSELEHIIRAAGSIANDSEIVVIGSQSILGQFPKAPASLLVSPEAGVFPMHNPQLSDLIDSSIGEGSPFHQMYGYYAQSVDHRTATLPSGWRDRE